MLAGAEVGGTGPVFTGTAVTVTGEESTGVAFMGRDMDTIDHIADFTAAGSRPMAMGMAMVTRMTMVMRMITTTRMKVTGMAMVTGTAMVTGMTMFTRMVVGVDMATAMAMVRRS